MEDSARLTLDPEEAETYRRERLRRLHVRRVPRLRAVGLSIFVAMAWAHHQVLLEDPTLLGPLVWASLAVAAHGVLSWALLVRFYDRVRAVDLGDLFLVVDLAVVTALIWATGADRSLLFFLLAVRAADQAFRGFRRTLAFSGLALFFYGALMVGLELSGTAVDWPVVAVKTSFIAALSLYLLGVARAADDFRRQAAGAIRRSRSLLGRLQQQSQGLEKQASEARDASTTKSRFLANMSHEIRTPMNAIIGVNRLLLRTELSPESKRYARIIGSSADNLLQLIDSILDLSKVEAGKLELDVRPFSLNHLVDHTVMLVRSHAQEKGLPLHLERKSRLPDWVLGDVARLRQILLNLLGNAVKFTRQGSVTLQVESFDEGWVRFTVEDTGIGISEEGLERLFDPFSRADTTARQVGGTGLGLNISRHLAEAMSGRITVESEPGKGSAFTLEVPLEATEALDAPRSGSMPIPLRPATRSARILVADDNEINRMLTRAELESLGLEVETVCTGREALEALEGSEAFDMVFLDCEMPELDGYETARRIRAQEGEGHIPIIALTAHAMKGDRERCLAAGMDDYITKPFRESDLAEVLACWLSAFDPPEPSG